MQLPVGEPELENVVVSSGMFEDNSFLNSSKFSRTGCDKITCLANNESPHGISYFRKGFELMDVKNFITSRLEPKYLLSSTLAAGINLEDADIDISEPKMLKVPIIMVSNKDCFVDFIEFDFSIEPARLECRCSRALGYSDFSMGEFEYPLTIEGLCHEIKEDGYNLSLKSLDNTIEWLNDLLKFAGFYNNILREKRRFNFPEGVKDLVEKTRSYRSNHFSDLKKEEQNAIKRLNRLLLEEIYPNKTPKSCKIDKNFCTNIKNPASNLYSKAINIAKLIRKATKEHKGFIPFFKYSMFLDHIIWESNFRKHLNFIFKEYSRELDKLL